MAPKRKTSAKNLRISPENSKRKCVKKTFLTKSLSDHSDRTESCNEISDVFDLENRVTGIEKNSSQTSSKISKKTSKKKSVRKTSVAESLTDLSVRTELPNDVSDVAGLKEKTTDSEEKSSKFSIKSCKKKSVRKITAAASLTDLSVKTGLPEDVSDVAELKERTTNSEKSSSKISTKSSKRNSVRKIAAAESLTDLSAKTKLSKDVSNVTGLKKTSDIEKNSSGTSSKIKKSKSLADFSARTELCNEISNIIKLKNRTTDCEKNSSKTSPRTSKRKSTRKKPVTKSLATLPVKTELLDEILNASALEENTSDDNKNSSNSKECTSDLLNLKEEFGSIKTSNQNDIKPFSSDKLTDQFSKSRLSSIHTSKFRSIVNKLKNLKIDPIVHTYSIKPEGKGISAVDISQNLSHVAYSFSHSSDINLCARNSLSDDIARRDLRTTWLNFVFARNKFDEADESEKEKTKRLSSPQVYVIRHNNEVSGLRFSSDDSILMSCSLDGCAKAISTTTFRILEIYDGYGSFTGIDVNSKITKFVTTSTLPCTPFHVAYLYTLERKDPVQTFSGHQNSLKCIRFHPNGLYFATAAYDQSIKLWSVHQSKEVRHFKDGGIDNPKELTFSSDGKYIASAYDGCVKIWDIASGRKLKHLNVSSSDNYNFNICYNFDGSILAAGGTDKQIHFWNVTSDVSSEISPEYDFLKTECLGKTVFVIKYASHFFSCVTG